MFQTRCVQSAPTTKLPKMAMDRQEHCGNGTPRVPGVPCDATPSPMYLGTSPQPEPTTTLFIIISTSFVTKWSKVMKNCKSGVFSSDARPNRGPPAQRSSKSDSVMRTSMAIATFIGSNWSIGDPSICWVAGLQV